MGANDKAAATYHPGTGPDARRSPAVENLARCSFLMLAESAGASNAEARTVWEGDVEGRKVFYDFADIHAGLILADADREAGFHRVRVDDATVEKAARALFEVRDDPYDDDEWEDLTSSDRELYECQARAVLAALTGAES